MENRGLIRSSKANVSSRGWAAPSDAILSVPLWLREIICLGVNESACLKNSWCQAHVAPLLIFRPLPGGLRRSAKTFTANLVYCRAVGDGRAAKREGALGAASTAPRLSLGGHFRPTLEKVLTESRRHGEERQRERDAVRFRSERARRKFDGESRAYSIVEGERVVTRLGCSNRCNSLRASVAP
jgi:hypothetical protein